MGRLFCFLAFLPFSLVGCQPVDLGSFDASEVCKAGIATTMGKNPSTVKFDGSNDEIYEFYYYRKSGGPRWEFRCKLKRDRIVWATPTGPWRDRSSDPVLEFAIEGNRISVAEIFSDGSSRSEIYTKSQL